MYDTSTTDNESTDQTIDLRSDTLTQPTDAMRQAMATAEVGDDMFGEDPTVNRLEAKVAARLGKEAAVYVPSGTMGNLASLMAHAQPGDEVLLGSESHIYNYEAGNIASLGGLMPRLIQEVDGLLQPQAVLKALRPPNQHFPRTRLLCLENTHNRGGGRITPLALHHELCSVARDHGLQIHLDGARLFNVEVATGVPVAEYAATVDSISVCLSKGLSAPVGSLVAGDAEFIAKVRLVRKRLGGAMRQAGSLAAAGIVALDTMVERLADDHAHARLMAEALAQTPGLQVNLASVETNMIFVNLGETGLNAHDFLPTLKAAGILAFATADDTIRLVLHRHITRDMATDAVRRIQLAINKT